LSAALRQRFPQVLPALPSIGRVLLQRSHDDGCERRRDIGADPLDRFDLVEDEQEARSPALLANWKAQPGMLGVRVTFLGASETWLADGTADWFWPAAEKAGLPVMCLTAGHGLKFARIAERHPRLTLIVDHMGVSTAIVKAGKTSESIGDAVALAKYPNVSVKLSAAPNYSSEPYPFRDFLPHIRVLFDAYGPQRCYWGTDLTNGFSRATYRQRITHFTEEMTFLSESDKDWIMGRAILARLRWT